MSYRLTILKNNVIIKVHNTDLPPTSEEIDKLLAPHPGSTFDICRVELQEEDFDYRDIDLA